jgi:outer membrane protein assembly factor BamA
VRLGVAFGFEPTRWDQRVSARYSHENLFHALYRLRLTARAGYAELPNFINPQAHGPVAEIDLYTEKKGLLEKHLVWTLEPQIELGIEQGYQYWSTQNRFGVSRFFGRWVQLRVNHTLRYVNFFSISPTLRTQDTFLSLDFRDPYVISYVGAGATVFAVDRITSPNNGAVIDLDYRVAGGPFGGQYDFQELTPSVRLYWRPIERLQFAGRAQLGLIFPFGDQPGAPIDLRQYLGGTDTVRGWGLRRLAPRVDNCESGQSYRDGTCESIPVGGNTFVLANFEVRVRTWKQLWVAGFVDGGDVQLGISSFVPAQWNYSAGGGLRYDSPIGKFRLDAGVRLNETLLSEGEPIWAIHFGLGESF